MFEQERLLLVVFYKVLKIDNEMSGA